GSERVYTITTQAVNKVWETIDDKALIVMVMGRQHRRSAPRLKRPLHPWARPVDRPGRVRRVVKVHQLPEGRGGRQRAEQPIALNRRAGIPVRLMGIAVEDKEVHRPPYKIVVPFVVR